MNSILLSLLLLTGFTNNSVSTLVTPNYKVMIEVRCPEGSVTCDDVKYVGINKKTKQSITLIGRTKHLTGRDGVTPSRFLGYEFENKGYVYFVSEEGRLTVSKGAKVVVDESGKWK